jgi:hypothetical protein
LFASREQDRGTNHNANVFFHKVVGKNPIRVTSIFGSKGSFGLIDCAITRSSRASVEGSRWSNHPPSEPSASGENIGV